MASMSGLRQLQEISLAAHPLDKDQAVAQAWGQPSWADYTGISRTLSRLSWEEVHHLVAALEEVSQPFVIQDIQSVRRKGKRLPVCGPDRAAGLEQEHKLPERGLWPQGYGNPFGLSIRYGQSHPRATIAFCGGSSWRHDVHHPGRKPGGRSGTAVGAASAVAY